MREHWWTKPSRYTPSKHLYSRYRSLQNLQLTVALRITKMCSTTSGLREHLRGLRQRICTKIVSSVQNSEAALRKCQKYSHLNKAIIIIPVAILIWMEKSHRYYPQMKTSMLPKRQNQYPQMSLLQIIQSLAPSTGKYTQQQH